MIKDSDNSGNFSGSSMSKINFRKAQRFCFFLNHCKIYMLLISNMKQQILKI